MAYSSETNNVRNRILAILFWLGVVAFIWKAAKKILRALYTEYGVSNVKDLSHKLVDEYVPMQQRSQVQQFLHQAEDSVERLHAKVQRPARRASATTSTHTAQPPRSSEAEAPFALNARQEQIYGFIKRAKQAAMADLSGQIAGVTDRTLRRDLTKLEKLGLVEQVGRTKSSFYRLRL